MLLLFSCLRFSLDPLSSTAPLNSFQPLLDRKRVRQWFVHAFRNDFREDRKQKRAVPRLTNEHSERENHRKRENENILYSDGNLEEISSLSHWFERGFLAITEFVCTDEREREKWMMERAKLISVSCVASHFEFFSVFLSFIDSFFFAPKWR